MSGMGKMGGRPKTEGIERFSVVTSEVGGGTTGIFWVEAGDAAS